jgi:HNH endonuclease
MYTEEFKQRFWAKVARCLHGDTCRECCWLWQGAKTGLPPSNLYGVIWAPPAIRQEGKRYIKAHHMAWEMRHGPLPPGLWVLHNCPGGDNSLCVNYNDHLWLGTARDNNHDMIQKGRARYLSGAERGLAKLSPQDVVSICALQGTLTLTAIAALYDVHRQTVADILYGDKWQHVPREPLERRPQAEQVATLTKEQVCAIRAYQGHLSERQVARQVAISRSQVGRIWRRECWDWLADV